MVILRSPATVPAAAAAAVSAWSERIRHPDINELAHLVVRFDGAAGEEDAVAGGDGDVFKDLPVYRNVGLDAEVIIAVGGLAEAAVATELGKSEHVHPQLELIQ